MRFALVLVVDHACNLRCAYCYTGAKFRRPMPESMGRKAIARAVATLAEGGTLELGFFGGEPLLQAALVARLLTHARRLCDERSLGLRASLTTNGTIAGPEAWPLFLDPDLELAISHDGLAHDRRRRSREGGGTSLAVLRTIERLRAHGREVRVVTVVGPDTLGELADSLVFLRGRGVARVDLSLDLWAAWKQGDASRLDSAITDAATVWRGSIPSFGVSWFDEKLARLARLPYSDTARCGVGGPQVAVTPSGRLYPCERLVGDDPPDHPMRLQGHALGGDDFLSLAGARCTDAGEDRADACASCRLRPICGTTCRCSNYVRTGDARRPDGLLCLVEKLCVREAARAFTDLAVGAQRATSPGARP